MENIQHWLTVSAYAEYQPAILDLVEQRNERELTRLFWEQIPFGTGGRRGPMAEFGSATINHRTIAESAWGLGQYVLQWRKSASVDAGTQPRAVIGYDGRHRSAEFADVTARVLLAAGFQVFLYREPRATPQLSFSVRHLHCDCGVMISASHNPPGDNGFKAYWSSGVQVLAPHDAGIIACVQLAGEIALADRDAAAANGQCVWLDDTIDQAYVAAVTALSQSSQRQVRLLYTPLHGVGESSIVSVLRQAGFADVGVFAPQQAIDGDFPNVPDHLPNPERSAVLFPAINFARDPINSAGEPGHDLVLASDPDADRLAVAVRTAAGSYVCLTGNQLGALLTDYAVAQRKAALPHGYVVSTLVTTPLIPAIARAAGLTAIDELPVGFKHIGATMEERGADQFVFGAEESLGYLAGDYARDKDAALAALWCAELAAELKATGRTLCDRLAELQQQHGCHRESQVSRSFPGPEGVADMARLIERFRRQPPDRIGEAVVRRIRDYGQQVIRVMPDNRVTEQLAVHAGDLLFAETTFQGVSAQVALRPSGTEAKLKLYFFAQAKPFMPLREADERTLDAIKELQNGFDEWIQSTSKLRT